MSGSLFVISAPSGTGKTSLVKALLTELNDLEVAVSHTTRPKRQGETDKHSYYFVSESHFKQLVRAEAFIEYAKVFDHYYGTSKQAVSDQLAAGKDIILEIDWQGALQVKGLYSQAQLIFVLPPSLGVLEQRLKLRAEDSREVISKRLAGAIVEMQQYHHYDYLVVNDNFTTASEQIKAIVTCNRLKKLKQEKVYHRLINQLGIL